MASAQSFTHYRTCNLCEAMCGVAIEVEDEQILSIKGDKDDPFSKGHICPKAVALKDLQEDPDRLKVPHMKTKEGWKKISWSRAFDIVADKIKETQKRHGRHAVGAYAGNPNTHHHGNILFGGPFLQALRTRNKFSATSNDQLPHMHAALEMFGHQLLLPVPDLDHTDLFILFGSNPVASNGSVTTAPDYGGRLKKIVKRGGEFILFDPRRTETANLASDHYFVKPGTDAYVLLGMINTLFDEGLIETGRLSSHLEGIAEIQLISSDFSAEKVAEISGVASETIRSVARKLATTPRAALYGRMGTSTQEFGGLATWLIYVINVLTNHLDERGGLMFSKPAADLIEIGAWAGLKGNFNRYQSLSGLPEFNGELPSSAMADQILLPGDEQIKMMIIMAGNPVLSNPNGQRLEQALESLDFMVSIDFYINETSSHADIILPPTSPLEQSHYDVIFHLLAIRNTAKFSPALFEADKDARHDWEILLELKRRLVKGGLKHQLTEAASYQALKRLGPDGVLDIILRSGPYGTQLPGTAQAGRFVVDAVQGFLPTRHPVRKILDLSPYGSPNRSVSKGLCVASLQNYPHGIDLGPLQSRLPERLYTSNKRIRLASNIFLKDMTRLRKRLGQATASQAEGHFQLIGRRHVRSNNSWLHNSHRLVKGKNRCTMLINPSDAERLDLKQGDIAKISSRVGSIQIETQISDEMMPGVISVPHGWGHHRKGSQMSIASKHAGVSINDLSDDKFVDKLNGTSALNGLMVEVVKLGASDDQSSSQTKSTRSSSKAAKPSSAKPAKARAKKATGKASNKSRLRVSAKLS